MFSAMTPGSNHTVVLTRTGTERECCMLCQQQTAIPDNTCFISQRVKGPTRSNPPCFRTRVKFRFKDRVRMEQREPTEEPTVEGTKGALRELVSKWFIDTQVPLILNNGLFPSWFMGFISRKDAENLLKDKELGCFLIRLSDKTIGYILSYKGRDRCRHFVISQRGTGQYVVCGDTEGHKTVLELINYYKTSPVEPFGEYLTSPCFRDHSEEIYDIIHVSSKDKPEVVLRAEKNRQKQHINSMSDHPQTRQPKGNKSEEEVPPLPRRSRHIDSGAFTDEHDRVMYAQLQKQPARENQRGQHVSQDSSLGATQRNAERSMVEENNDRCSPTSGPESVYYKLNPLDNKSKSLPLLDSSSDGEQSYRLSVPPDNPPRLSPKLVRQMASNARQLNGSQSLEGVSNNYVYHLAGPMSCNNGSSTAVHQNDSLYAEVAIETPVISQDGTYELLPDHKEPAKPKPNGKPVEDSKHKHNHSSWGIKNDKWKWLFPEAKRK